MKIHFLPELQETRNKEIIKKLRWLGGCLFVMFLLTAGLGIYLYTAPPLPVQSAQCMGGDGTVYGDAIFVSPEMVVCAGNVSAAEITTGTERYSARKVSTATIGDRTEITLLRLQSGAIGPPVTAVVADQGQRLTAASDGLAWEGTVRSLENGAYVVDPEFSLPAGVGVFLSSDKTGLVGISAQSGGKAVVVPITEVIKKMPDLAGAR